MKKPPVLVFVVAAIAAVTFISGLVQMIAPAVVLHLIGGGVNPASQHFFGIVGMFMLLFGAALFQEVLSTPAQPIVALWAGLQKFGAVAAVFLGVVKGVFSPLALLVSCFDLISAVIIIAYWRQIRKPA